MKRLFIVLLAIIVASVTAEGRKVKGTVKCEKEGLSGVIVTDGYDFTVTKSGGKFAFDISDDAEFVYIITPAGYVADWSSGVPAFYIPVSGRKSFDFNLQRTCGSDTYHIIAVSDPQAYSDEHFAKFAAEPLDDLAKTASSLDGDAVGISLGDISWDRIDILDMYKKEIVRAGIPFYPVVGNHDNEAYVQGDREAAAAYRSKMGPENYAFFMGNDLVIALDNIIYDTNFKSEDGYTDDVIGWVRGLLQLVSPDTDLYVAQHVPMGRGRRRLVNEDKLLELIQGHNVTVLSGHTHINSNREVQEGINDHNVAAICGAWWDTKHCSDGTPRGYKVFTKSNQDLTWYYKPVDYDKNHIAEVFALDAETGHPDAVVVNVWDWDPQWKVEWYEDGIHKGAMTPVRAASPIFAEEIKAAYASSGEEIPGWKRARPSGHHFSATPSPSAHSVTIFIESRFGQKWSKTVELPIVK